MNIESKVFSFMVSTRVLFGVNAVTGIGREARRLSKSGRRALMVTDRRIIKLGLVDKVRNPLGVEGFDVEIFDGVESEPPLEVVDAITELVRDGEYDLIVGLGGGSCMDAAKIGSVMATNPGSPSDYLGNNLLKRRGLPKILIPTTAGTGSEVSRGAVVSVGDRKEAISDTRYGFANVAIVDPIMSISMPPEVTARSGFDALSHAIECFICKNSNPISDAIAIKAVELIANNLRIAYADGKNLAARHNMSLAALMAGIAFENSCLTSTHVLAERIGPILKVPHGVALSIVLPSCLEFYAKDGIRKLAIVARTMGEDITRLSQYNSAMKAVEAVKKLGRDLGLPTSLREIKATEEDVQRLIEAASKDVENMPDPRRMTRESLLKVCKNMLEV